MQLKKDEALGFPVKLSLRYLLLILISCSLTFAHAQSDSAPQEEPFVEEDTEFDTPAAEAEDASLSEQDEAQSETVNLNEAVPEQTVEDEVIFDETPLPIVDAAEPESEPGTSATTSSRPKSAKGGVEYIEHPQAAKGLMMITKEGAYIYRVKPTVEHTHTGSIRFGSIDSPRILTQDETASFETLYSSAASQSLVMFDYDWQPFQSFGKLGVQIGAGLMTASGNGQFASADPELGGKKPLEKYTLLAVPLNIGLVYRLEWQERQWIAPYVSAGGTYVGLVEFRDDDKPPSILGTPGFYGGGGLLFNVSAIGRDTAFTLSSEYGIRNLWVTLDYRYLATTDESLDFTSSIIGAGIGVDY